MNSYKLRLARKSDLPAVLSLRRHAIQASAHAYYSQQERRLWAEHNPTAQYQHLIHCRCMWLTENKGQIVASAALDIDKRELTAVYVAAEFRGRGLGRKLTQHVERMAAAYGLLALNTQAALHACPFYQGLGYQPHGPRQATCMGLKLGSQSMVKSLKRRQTSRHRRIFAMLRELGITHEYGLQHRFPIQHEARNLRAIGEDKFNREQHLKPGAARAWQRMNKQALNNGVTLEVVSAFRTTEYQASIIRRKLAYQSIEDILKVSAAPGFSEHHTGRALDLSCPQEHEVLTQDFATTSAYQWLLENAARFGFRQSFPRDNPHRLTWEPWHWAWWPGQTTP